VGCQASSRISLQPVNTVKDDSRVLILSRFPLGLLVVGLVLKLPVKAQRGTRAYWGARRPSDGLASTAACPAASSERTAHAGTWLSSLLYLGGRVCQLFWQRPENGNGLFGRDSPATGGRSLRQTAVLGRGALEGCRSLNVIPGTCIKGVLTVGLASIPQYPSRRRPGFAAMIFSSEPSSERSKLKLLPCLRSLKLGEKLEW